MVIFVFGALIRWRVSVVNIHFTAYIFTTIVFYVNGVWSSFPFSLVSCAERVQRDRCRYVFLVKRVHCFCSISVLYLIRRAGKFSRFKVFHRHVAHGFETDIGRVGNYDCVLDGASARPRHVVIFGFQSAFPASITVHKSARVPASF